VPAPAGWGFWHTAWTIFGAIGMIIFYGRFYVQWIASEIQKRSVVPIAFWYMSSVGSVMQFIYAVYRVSPGGAFGQCFNIVIYTRNLIHIWREKGRLTRGLNIAAHGLAGLIALTAVGFMVTIWMLEYKTNQALDPAKAAQNWFWLGVWGIGQTLFFLRFAVQWIVSEIKKKSVVPPVFWYFSLAATILQAAAFSQRQEWIFAIGMISNIPVYSRNIWFIHRAGQQESSAEG
jgi:lipid-A-disaccharide synthase-like uncharacterized protein